MMSNNKHHDSGFTLIEILATFVLIAIILPVAMKGISLATNMASDSKRKVEATTLAKFKLTEITTDQLWEQGTASGDFSPDWPNYKWEMLVSTWTDASARQVDLLVSWDARQQQRSIILTTLVYAQDN
ncbi:MAG: type II secretion system protein [Planctomycetota bacterium]|jgi:prepilin-type N-terminal cleavage/methylation domain-containing protein